MGLEKEIEGLSFLDKLIIVIELGELDYWEDRANPPNLSVDEFLKVLERIEETAKVSWIDRISKNGPHGKTGEKNCFKINCEIKFGGIFDIERKFYFIKGYFFDDGELKGVTIQSFREDL